MKYTYGDMVYSLYGKNYHEMMVLRFDEKLNRYLCVWNDGLDFYGFVLIKLYSENEIALLNDKLIPGSGTYKEFQDLYKSVYPMNIDTNFYDMYIFDKSEKKLYRKAFRYNDGSKIYTKTKK